MATRTPELTINFSKTPPMNKIKQTAVFSRQQPLVEIGLIVVHDDEDGRDTADVTVFIGGPQPGFMDINGIQTRIYVCSYEIHGLYESPIVGMTFHTLVDTAELWAEYVVKCWFNDLVAVRIAGMDRLSPRPEVSGGTFLIAPYDESPILPRKGGGCGCS